jgi:hypothetical protein
VRAVGADVIRAEHEHGCVGVLGADHRCDVAKRSVVRRIVVQHDNLEIDAVLVGLVDQVEQGWRDRRRRADVADVDLLLNDRQARIGVARRIGTDGATDLARDVEARAGWSRLETVPPDDASVTAGGRPQEMEVFGSPLMQDKRTVRLGSASPTQPVGEPNKIREWM